MKKRASAVNEVKCRLDDEEFDELRIWAQERGFDSDAQALRRCVREHLLGVRGARAIVHARQNFVSANVGHSGPRS